MIRRLDLRAGLPANLGAVVPRAAMDVDHALDVVRPIVADVAKRGAPAVLDHGERLDGVRPTHLRVPATAIASALEQLDPDVPLEVLSLAEKKLPKLPEVARALATLRALAKACPVPASFDLAELRGYHYHSGVVFDAYCEGVAGAVGRGGRYDEVGKAFGRARPATGFSIDLRSLASAAGSKGQRK